MLKTSQVKAARALIGWSQQELAKTSGIALPTIKRMETGADLVRGNVDSVWKVQKALEDAGIQFIPENGGGAGVRMKKADTSSSLPHHTDK